MRTTWRLALLCALGLALTACPSSQGTNGSGDAPSKAAGASDPDGQGAGGSLGDLEAAVEGLTVSASAAGAQSPRYSVPEGCTLGYEFESDASVKMEAMKSGQEIPAQAMNIVGSFGLSRRGDAGLKAGYGEIKLGFVRAGHLNPGSVQASGTLAETFLTLTGDGRVFSEVDGPTTAWAAYGSHPGAVIFFPGLPASPDVGASTPWKFDIYPRTAGAAVEASRGSVKLPEGATLPEVKAAEIPASVQVLGWLEVQGQAAMHLEAVWELEQTTSMEQTLNNLGKMSTTSTSRQRFVGRYLVLAKGRLLASHVEGHVDLIMTSAINGEAKPAVKQHHAITSRARLVEGCGEGEVVARPFSRVVSAETRVLEAWRGVRNAAFEGKYDEAASRFDPELRQRHGDKLGALLKRHVDRYSAFVLGQPEMASEITREGGLYRVSLSGSARDFEEEGHNMTVHTTLEARVDDADKIWFVRVGTDTLKKSADFGVLEISAERLFSSAP